MHGTTRALILLLALLGGLVVGAMLAEAFVVLQVLR